MWIRIDLSGCFERSDINRHLMEEPHPFTQYAEMLAFCQTLLSQLIILILYASSRILKPEISEIFLFQASGSGWLNCLWWYGKKCQSQSGEEKKSIAHKPRLKWMNSLRGERHVRYAVLGSETKLNQIARKQYLF